MTPFAPAILIVAVALPGGWLAGWIGRRFIASAPPVGLAMIALQAAVALAAAAVVPPRDLAATLGLGWTLSLLATIDVVALRLPDVLTLPLAAAGLVFGPLALRSPLGAHVIGAVAGYATLAGLGWVFVKVRGREGLGLGDAKLFAAAGAWLDWRALPVVALVAAGLGLGWVAVAAMRRGKTALAEPIAFGAPLAAAFWLAWLLATRRWPL